jgi:general secretion pathway protein C
VIDNVLEQQAELRPHVRIVPDEEKGKVLGIRLFGIRSGTLLESLGFENGDRFQRINGYDMTNPENALEVYAHLRNANMLVVEVNRKGKERYLVYRVV